MISIKSVKTIETKPMFCHIRKKEVKVKTHRNSNVVVQLPLQVSPIQQNFLSLKHELRFFILLSVLIIPHQCDVKFKTLILALTETDPLGSHYNRGGLFYLSFFLFLPFNRRIRGKHLTSQFSSVTQTSSWNWTDGCMSKASSTY